MEPISEGRTQAAASAGAWLRNARQQRGLHIAALAVMLKVPQAKLEALEADRFDLLPDATFARALATAMCRALKVDPAPVLALLPRSSDQGLDVRQGLNQPFRERNAGSGMDVGGLSLVARPVVWGPVLLLLAAAAVYWVPAGWLSERVDPATTSAAFPASAIAPAASASAPVEFVSAPLTSPASAPVVVGSPVTPPVASPASAPLPVASAPLQVREVPAPVAAAPSAVKPALTVAPEQALKVTATAETWVEVVDAQGQVLVSRVLREGEQQAYGGAAPYKVRVGNVRGTRLEWRGAVVDLAARGSNNVARLELN